MPNDPTPALLERFNQNITALGCAIDEIGIWIAKSGATDVSGRIADHLKVLEGNTDAIAKLMTDLIARWRSEEEIDPEDRYLRLAGPIAATHRQVVDVWSFGARNVYPKK
jgi:hypothetical protein